MTPVRARVTTTLVISGMTCSHCAQHVESALAAVPDVTARVDLDTATAEVHHDTTVFLNVLIEAVQEAGYTARVHGQLFRYRAPVATGDVAPTGPPSASSSGGTAARTTT